MKLRINVLLTVMFILFNMTVCWGQNSRYLDKFDTVWKKVNDTFYDSTFGGFNWKDAYDRYLPQISAAENDEEYYRLVNRMLWELKVSHTNLVPPGRMALSEPLVCAEGSPGFDIRLLNGVAVVTSVRPQSPAGNAGLRPGYAIETVDGITTSQIIREAESAMRPPYNNSGRTAIITKAILGRIYGTPDTEVPICYSDEKGQKVEKKLLRIKRSGVAVGPKGILYLAVDFEIKRFDNGIGYIRLNTFQPPLTAQISAAIKSLGDVTGIILDIRGNSGGEIEGMPDLFLQERKLLYLSRTRNGETKVFIDPAEDAFSGQLVLVADQLSGSASELFAGSLQAAGRAVVIGERSPGAVMESDMMIFPTGAIFMYPVAQLATPDGTVLEGHGVIPDIEVKLDREMLLKGVDSQIEAAIKYLGEIIKK